MKKAGYFMLPFILFSSSLFLPLRVYSYSHEYLDTSSVETLVYQDLARYGDTIQHYCKVFDVDVATIIAILYTEKMQYELDVLRSGKKHLESLVSTFPLFISDLYTWSQLTAGYTHLKEDFVRETKARLDDLALFDEKIEDYETDPAYYIAHPNTAIKITIAGIALLAVEWEPVCSIRDRPGILATLYNIGYKNSHPHGAPETGGSTMPIIIDGEYITDCNFGERVNRLYYHSRVFNEFINTTFQ